MSGFLGRLFGRRGGLLPRKVYLSLVLAIALLSPVLVLRGFLLAPFDRVPSPRPAPHDLDGDPLVAVGVLGRAWLRWDSMDFSRTDDRVFAPYPDVWGIAESSTLIAVVGYPFYKATGSFAFGFNAAYYLACALTGLAAGLFFGRLAGRGWPALLGTLLFLWCPGRLNNLGVVQTLWAGLTLLPLACLLGFRRTRSARDAVLSAAGFVVVSLGTLYGALMGATVIAVASPVILWPLRRHGRALLLLAAPWAAAAAFLVWFYAPFLSIGREFEIRPSQRNIEGHAADVLSVLHHGVFSGPLRTICDRVVPGLPEGSSALFPTLLLTIAAGLTLALREPAWKLRPKAVRLERRPLPWLLISVLFFSFAIGPTPRLAGETLGVPGPYRLLSGLPGFGTMRGIHRWDQWFGLAAIAGAVLLASRLLTRRNEASRMRILALLACATLVDVWPRYVPGQQLPGPSPFQRIHLAAGRDTVLALYPARPFLSERAWVEQLYHGRRLVNGFNSFAPPLHAWLDRLERDAPAAVVLQVHREMGAAAVDVHLDEIPGGKRGEVEELLGSLSAAGNSVLCSAGRCLVAFREVLEPQLVTPSRVRGLVFRGGEAVAATSPGRLILRLSGGELPVRIRTPEDFRDDVLDFPLVSAERMTARLRSVPPPGAVVETPDAAVLGTVR